MLCKTTRGSKARGDGKTIPNSGVLLLHRFVRDTHNTKYCTITCNLFTHLLPQFNQYPDQHSDTFLKR